MRTKILILLSFVSIAAIGGFGSVSATSPRFYPGVLDVFRHLAPMTTFLNEPLRPNP